MTGAEFRGDLSVRNARGNAPRNGNISEGEIKKAGNPREIRSPGYYSDSASPAERKTFDGEGGGGNEVNFKSRKIISRAGTSAVKTSNIMKPSLIAIIISQQLRPRDHCPSRVITAVLVRFSRTN